MTRPCIHSAADRGGITPTLLRIPSNPTATIATSLSPPLTPCGRRRGVSKARASNSTSHCAPRALPPRLRRIEPRGRPRRQHHPHEQTVAANASTTAARSLDVHPYHHRLRVPHSIESLRRQLQPRAIRPDTPSGPGVADLSPLVEPGVSRAGCRTAGRTPCQLERPPARAPAVELEQNRCSPGAIGSPRYRHPGCGNDSGAACVPNALAPLRPDGAARRRSLPIRGRSARPERYHYWYWEKPARTVNPVPVAEQV